ncbi:DNA polymerase II [Treponema sp. TIM-1]|uniref:DNA polymerase domain-containing protein n=1 Tax=Treponema sp. TIM-1 TaxID=2898417 RepID=UPI00397FE355
MMGEIPSDKPSSVASDLSEESGVFRGFIVHASVDPQKDRLFFVGRLEDGRSFAAVEAQWRPYVHIREEDWGAWDSLVDAPPGQKSPAALESFSGRERLLRLDFSRYGDRAAGVKLLERAGIPSPDGDTKPPEAFLLERRVRGPVELRGQSRPGRFVDVVFPHPQILPAPGPVTLPLKTASVDIETDMGDGSLRAVGVSWTGTLGRDQILRDTQGLVRVLGSPDASPAAGVPLFFHPDERSLLAAFIDDIRRIDPDVITGWNFLDFDFPRLAERCEFFHIPFNLGRSGDRAKYFPGEGRRSGAALIPGRQVLDALRIVRSGPQRFSDYTLQTVSREVLGEGKLVTSSGKDKAEELDRLYREDIRTFGAYCCRDAELVLRILAETGLFRLTLERASLTGVSLDKAWTSVVSFERIYALELGVRGIAPPPAVSRRVSGAAGGTVLDPRQGLFRNIAVFDFRSLYPTIIRTFNIDPLARERVSSPGISPAEAPITAPNGAVFSRSPGILPALIAEYFAARREALDRGDEIAAHVYKILMNSFYGVLGTAACRYGLTELAGAITSFARKWLLFSRDWFTGQGCPVLYGDTDSLFVETGLDDQAGFGDFLDRCGALAKELNVSLSRQVQAEYRLTSFMELRFEKAYRRFMIPPLRGLHEAGEIRGRAKGYGGYLLHPDGTGSVEVKGMEAVRSDVTPLARRVQLELLALVFAGGGEGEFREKIFETVRLLKAGALDGELVYRKRLSRPPETYTSSTPPQVKAARALGWKARRGTVEYLWTEQGPEPVSLPHAPPDYEHYLDSQVLPVARSIADAAGWTGELFPRKSRDRRTRLDRNEGQLDLDL